MNGPGSSDSAIGKGQHTLVAHVLVGDFAIGVTGQLGTRPGA